MAHRLLDRHHSDARSVQPRRKRPAPRVTARLDACCLIDRFETQAQTDIAEMPTSASAANERPGIAHPLKRREILVQQLSQLVRDEDAPCTISLRLMLAEIDDRDSFAIQPAHVTDCERSDFTDTHPRHDAERQGDLVPVTVIARFCDPHDALDFVSREDLRLRHFPVSD